MTGPHDLLTDAADATDATDAADATIAASGGSGVGHPPGRGRRFSRRLLRVLATVSAVLVGLGAVGGIAQAVAERRDATSHAAPGELVDVGDGRSIHVQVSGEHHEGGPTVVLDAGLMGFSTIWAWVQADVAERATVVSYDRAGLGWSDPRDGDPSPEAFVEDLRTALDARGLDGPYVLVGHSFGGLLVRGFAAAHPEDVAGLVLVDPAHEDQNAELGEDYAAAVDSGERLLAVAHAATRVGVTRLYNPLAAGLEGLPDAESMHAAPRMVRADYLATVRDERATVDRVGDVVRDSGRDLGHTPMRILSAGAPEPGMQFSLRDVQDLHRRLTHLSTAATHEVVDDADHLTILTRRDHADDVSAHILDVVSEAR